MKRTSLALLLSFIVHIGIVTSLYDWQKKTPSLHTEQRIALHVSSLVVHSKEQMVEPPIPVQEESKPLQTTLTTPSIEAKPSAPKKEKRIVKTNTAPLVNDAKTILENNETTPLQSPPLNTEQSSLPQIEPAKQSYVQLHGNAIRAFIEKHKQYPEIARKRSLSDTVEVSFILTSTGEIEELHATSNSQILSKSAIETIHKAKAFFPIPTENVTIKIPIIYVIK